MRQILLIAWIAIRELLYERVFYLLVSFALVSLGLSVLLGQLTYAEQTKLTLDFMLGGTELAMILFSVFMGISLFHREINLGSIAMLLSKPISRTNFILGKFIGQMTVQAAVCSGMGILTVLICSRFGEPLSPSAVFQSVYFLFLESMVVGAATYFFAVNAGGITAAAASLGVFLIGHMTDSTSKAGQQSIVWQGVKALIPNLDLFNTKAIASYGASVSTEVALYTTLYALIFLISFLALASLCFQRRDIFT